MAVDIMAGQRHPELREEGKGLGLQRGGTQFKEDENEQLFRRQMFALPCSWVSQRKLKFKVL